MVCSPRHAAKTFVHLVQSAMPAQIPAFHGRMLHCAWTTSKACTQPARARAWFQ